MAAKATAASNGRGPALAAGFPTASVPNLEPLMQATNRMLESWVALSTEVLEFNKARLDQSLEAGRAIASSSSINEAIDLQAQFTRNMFQEYLTEATKIADMSTRSIMDGIAAIQKTAATETSLGQAAE